jgi:hypothetical protein
MSKPTDPDGLIGSIIHHVGDSVVATLMRANGGKQIGIVIHCVDRETGGICSTTNLDEVDFHRLNAFVVDEAARGAVTVTDHDLDGVTKQ